MQLTLARLFEQMIVDLVSEFQHLLFYFNVRWLSSGKLLRRVVDLRTELQIFLNEKIIAMPFCSKYAT